MTKDEIRSIVENYIAAELPSNNRNWIGEPDAEDIMQNPKFIIRKADKHTTEKDQVILAAISATENMLAVKIYNYALERYAKIDAGEFFDSTTWANFSIKLSGDLHEYPKDGDWQRWTKYFVNDDIEKNFGKNCIKVASLQTLAKMYDETIEPPFEDWFCKQMRFSRKGLPNDFLFEYLIARYGQDRFSVCVPDDVRQNYRHDPPLHECRIHKISE